MDLFDRILEKLLGRYIDWIFDRFEDQKADLIFLFTVVCSVAVATMLLILCSGFIIGALIMGIFLWIT